MVKARKYIVRTHFHGVPNRDDFEIVEEELPPITDGEILLKTEWISVDPYMRAYSLRVPTPYDQYGFQIAVVEQSKAAEYPVGTRVSTHKGWRDYTIVDTKDNKPTERLFKHLLSKVPDLQGLSPSVAVGALGMPGATAYFGLLELCKPKPGETVVVTGAAGAVGSAVGQIAKIKGCRVVGFVGSDEKVQWLEKALGFDKAINYKSADIAAALKEAAPKGVDCYFDNVGGEISSTIMYQMNDFGRVAVCGSISAYNDSQWPKATILQPAFVFKQLKIEGFSVYRWFERWPECFTEMATWIKAGQFKVKEHVTEGFDNIYDAFIGMMAGENTGKAVVKV